MQIENDEYKELLIHEEPLNNGIAVSVVMHVFIFLAFTVKALFFTEPMIDFSQAVRVDLVGLPSKIPDQSLVLPPKNEEAKESAPTKEVIKEKTANSAPITAKPVPKLVAKPEADSISLDRIKNKQKLAMSKLKMMNAMDKLKSEVSEEEKKEQRLAGNGNTKAGSLVIKGNIISPGTALTGLSKLQHDSYVSDLDRHIKEHWTLPEWLTTKDYKAQIRVYINSKGILVRKVLTRSSGNPTYDEYAMDTIDKSTPFPPPPEKLSAVLEVNGFTVGFPE